MKDSRLKEFQHQVSDLLLRHRSLLDVSSKFQESNARVNRALMKAVTECGCIQVKARRQPFKKGTALSDMKSELETHVTGSLCDHCSDVIQSEMGKNLFYLTALCNTLGLELENVVNNEAKKLSTLGVFNLR
jgi:NTP pyrophosphatase (non-canonical NTP hydrolase)